MTRRAMVVALLAGTLGCGHDAAFVPVRHPDVGPFAPGTPRRLTFSPRDDMMPRVTGGTLLFTRQGERDLSEYTGLPRETCIAILPVEGGTLSGTLCPHDFLPLSDTLVHSWFEPSLSPDGTRLAFNWQRAYRISALGLVDANLLVTSLANPADTTQVRLQMDYVEAGQNPRNADVATDIAWIGNDTLRFLSTFEQIIKVKGGGAERVTDTIMRGLHLSELDLVTRVVRHLPGGDSVYAYANAPDGSIWLVREPDSTLLLRLDPATGNRTPVGRFSFPVMDLIAVDGAPVAALNGLLDIERMNPATGALESWDAFQHAILRIADAGGRRIIAEVEQATVLFGAPSDLWLVSIP